MDAVFARMSFTPLANLTGQPAISLPLGQAGDGMPLGVMLTAQTLREDLLLAVGAALEEAMPWHERRPAVDAVGGVVQAVAARRKHAGVNFSADVDPQ